MINECTTIAKCKLCLKVASLQESHYISAGIYKRLRDPSEKNPNPWNISRNIAVQTSKQLKAYLLCKDCEERLNKNGEKWVLDNCLQIDGNLPLASLLKSKISDISIDGEPTRIYFASKISGIDINAISYFAASIFWRGSIYQWNRNRSIPVNLGPFQEDFRQYLMGLKAFPKHSALWVIIREENETNRLTYTPIGRNDGLTHYYNFPMPGIAFILHTSKNIPHIYCSMSFVHDKSHPILVTNEIDRKIKDIAVKMIRRIK